MARMKLAEMQAASAQLREYLEALKRCFVGRDQLIDLLGRAMLQRQHVLVFGRPGTSKTAICDVAFSGMTGAEQFHTELSMFMTESAVFGPYDTKEMRENGALVHRTEGMLPEADVARLGEFLDANMSLLRSLLSALNERRMRRGRQIVDMPLHTVFCDTNIDPGDFLKKHPHAWAVLDRLLFITQVDYLDSEEEIGEMLRRFQHGQTTKINSTISLDLIRSLSELIIHPPTMITDGMILLGLAAALRRYRRKRQQKVDAEEMKVILPEISDRRLCFASEAMEANAVLDGRLQVVPEDMLGISCSLGTSGAEKDLLARIAAEEVETIKEKKGQQLDHAQLIAIEHILQETEKAEPDPDIGQAVETLKVLETQLEEIVPENDEVSTRKDVAGEKLSELRSRLETAALERAGLGGQDKS